MRHAILGSFVAFAALMACGENAGESVDEAGSSRERPGGDTGDYVASSNSDRGGQLGEAPDEPEFDRDMAYHFSNGERGATLSFGVPQTDNIALTLRCPPGAMGKTALVYINRPERIVAKRPETITLKADENRQQLAIETRRTQLGTTVEVAIDPRGSVLQAYRYGSALEVAYGDETIVIPSRSDDRAIDRFFSACSA